MDAWAWIGHVTTGHQKTATTNWHRKAQEALTPTRERYASTCKSSKRTSHLCARYHNGLVGKGQGSKEHPNEDDVIATAPRTVMQCAAGAGRCVAPGVEPGPNMWSNHAEIRSKSSKVGPRTNFGRILPAKPEAGRIDFDEDLVMFGPD